MNSAPSSQGISVYAAGGSVRLVSLTFHRLNKAFTPKGGGSGEMRWNGTNKCIDKDPYGPVNGAAVRIWDCWNGPNQQWTHNANGSLSNGGVCLDQPGENIGNRAQLQVWTCNGMPQQSWTRVGGVGNTYRNAWSGRCIDLPESNTTDGQRLHVWDCVGGANQSWGYPL